MALPTCVKCDSRLFEMKEIKVTGSNFRLMAVQCSKCGGVVGVQEFNNVGATLDKIAKGIRVLGVKLGVVTGL